jgi:hypothetical protein
MNYLISMNRHLRLTIFFILIFTSFFLLIGTGNLIFAVLFFGFLGLLIATNVSHAKNYSNVMEKSLEKALIQYNFHADNSYLSDDYLSGIALNKTDKKIAVFKRFNIKESFSPSIYNFNEILECSIKEDGDTIIHTVSKSLIARSMAGGVLFGGIGAVVGGLTGEKVASEKIYRATLSLTFDNLDYPIREVDFLNSNMLVDRNSEIYRKIYDDLNRWHKTISVIIKRNEKELNSNTV